MRVFADIIEFWKETWHDDKVLFFAEMIGTILALSAAMILSLASGQYLLTIFIFYTIANLCMIYASYKRKSSWILLMSAGFLIINAIGIINL